MSERKSPLLRENAGPANLEGRAAVHLKGEAAERNRHARALRASELRYRRVFETAPIGMLVLDAETGVIEDANRYLTDLLACPVADLVGHPLWSTAAFRNAATSRHCFRELLYEARVRYDNLPLETPSGAIRRVELVSTLYLADGHPFVQCTIRDVTARVQDAQAQQEAQDDLAAAMTALRETDPATHDSLTGLLSPRHLADSLSRELHRARRGKSGVTVSMLALDGFERIVATFGADAGDALLREVGRVLRERLRKSDLACRYPGAAGETGAEFGVVLPQSSRSATLERIAGIRRAIRALELLHDGRLVDPATTSAGIVSARPDHTAHALLHAARAALVAAQRAGGDRVVSDEGEDDAPHA